MAGLCDLLYFGALHVPGPATVPAVLRAVRGAKTTMQGQRLWHSEHQATKDNTDK